MRLKFIGWSALALAGAGLGGATARAAHCGACGDPADAVVSDQCAPPVASYRVRYQAIPETQTRTCYRPVYRTVWEDQPYTVMRNVYEQHVREECVPVQRPVVEYFDVPRQVTTYRTEYQQ